MRLVDRARTKYKGLPPPIRAIVGRIASIMPERVRYGERYWQVRLELRKSSRDAAFANARQAELLGAQIKRAAMASPHYGKKFAASGFTVSELARNPANSESLTRLPLLTKDEVRAAPEALLTRPAAELDLVTTSGSSGVPLKFFLNRDRSVVEWAFLLDAWAQVGFRPSDKRAALRGFEIPHVDTQPWEYEVGLRELRLSPFHMNDRWLPRYVEEISRRAIHYLHGYPSAIEILARFVELEGLSTFGQTIRGIILTSEAVHSHQAALFARVFPAAKVLSFYGQSEKVLFATSDPDDPTLFWFNPLYGVCELVDEEGRIVTELGGMGRIIGTGLRFSGMPFIRYDTGDLGVLAQLPGAANGYRMGVRNITPRRGQEFLVGLNNEIISMSALNIHSDAYTTMRIFMIEQDRPGLATVKAVLAPGHDARAAEAFVNEIGRKTGESLRFTLEIVDEIPAGPRGKRNWIRQSLDVAALRGGAGS